MGDSEMVSVVLTAFATGWIMHAVFDIALFLHNKTLHNNNHFVTREAAPND